MNKYVPSQKTNQKPPKITPEQARERGRKGGIAKGRIH